MAPRLPRNVATSSSSASSAEISRSALNTSHHVSQERPRRTPEEIPPSARLFQMGRRFQEIVAPPKNLEEGLDQLRDGYLGFLLLRNPGVAARNFHLIGELQEPFRSMVWERVLRRLEGRGVLLPREHMHSYEEFIQFMHQQGIGFDRRIHSLEAAAILVSNRQRISEMGRDRPLAVIVANTSDWNGAFTQSTCIDELILSGEFDVVYQEVGQDTGTLSALQRIHQSTGGRRIHTLMLAGHGSPFTLQLGSGHGSDADHLDVHDLYENSFSGLANLIDGQGQVILWACSTGAPFERPQNLPNLADRLSSLLPGRTIHSTTRPNNIVHLAVGEDRQVSITWTDDAVHVVRTDPQGRPQEIESEDGGYIPEPIARLLDEMDTSIREIGL